MQDRSHYVKAPSEDEFIEVIENFLWFTTCAAKGIWRRELPFVKYNFDYICHHECLIKLLSWYIGVDHCWNINVGKNGKWLKDYLPTDIWDKYLKIFVDGDYQNIWDAIFNGCELVSQVSEYISMKLNFRYPLEEIVNVYNYLKMVRNLPSTAISFND